MDSIVEMCKRNYGRTWTKEMIAALVAKDKLTPEQYREITKEEYTA